MKWDRGYISPYFVTDAKAAKTEFKNPLILLAVFWKMDNRLRGS